MVVPNRIHHGTSYINKYTYQNMTGIGCNDTTMTSLGNGPTTHITTTPA
eukprot:UN07382